MVAPEPEDHRLVHLREIRRQLAEHRVGIPDTGGEIFQRTNGAGLDADRVGDHFHPLLVRVVVAVVVGVVLHGNGVEKDRRIGIRFHRFVLLDDLIRHGVVGDKAAGPVVLANLLDVVHILKADEIVKPKVGVGCVAAPVFRPEAVDGRRLVALCFQIVGQSKHGFCDVLLIGLAAVGQIGD